MLAEEKAGWLSARCGKLTASRMRDAMDMLKSGEPSAKCKQLLFDLLAERMTGDSVSHVVTEAMEHGAEYEDEAADWFVETTGRDLRRSRLYDHPTIENFAATPDRELADGLVEIKCPTTQKFLRWKLDGGVPDEHKPQMLAQLACSQKTWCGFIAYDPRIRDEKQRMFMRRYQPTPEEIAAIEDVARKFLATLDAMWEKINV